MMDSNRPLACWVHCYLQICFPLSCFPGPDWYGQMSREPWLRALVNQLVLFQEPGLDKLGKFLEAGWDRTIHLLFFCILICPWMPPILPSCATYTCHLVSLHHRGPAGHWGNRVTPYLWFLLSWQPFKLLSLLRAFWCFLWIHPMNLGVRSPRCKFSSCY